MNLLMRLTEIKRRFLKGGINGIFMDDYYAEYLKRKQIEERLDHLDAHLQYRAKARMRMLEAEAKTMGRQK